MKMFFGDWSVTEDVSDRMVKRLDELKPEVILECGSGTSTYVIGKWTEANNAKLFSLEHLPEYLDKTREMCLNFKSVEVIFAPINIRKRCYSINELPRGIDFALIDGPPANIGRQETLGMMWNNLSPNFEVWLDDANRDHEKACLSRWEQEFPINIEIDDKDKGLAIITPKK